MPETSALILTRDCMATQIPSGQPVLLPVGTAVELTQSLGGTFTIRAPDGLFRISGKDADALGLDAAAAAASAESANGSGRGPLRDETVWNVLRTCYDPEIPVNIVDLGLVYDLRIEPLPTGRSRVAVKMTLTAPGCGMGATIAGDAQQKLLELPEVEDAAVDIVWEPPWHHSMISPAGRAQLGLD